MKKLLFILLIGMLGSGSLLAQPGGQDAQPPKGEIIQKIIAYEMTKRLNLSVEEAQRFWPVFNKYQDEWFSAVKANKDDVIKRGEEVIKVQKKYKPDFQRILNSEERANRVFKAHGDIIEKIRDKAERMREKRQNNPNPRLERRNGRNNMQ
jgi:hypothetical protein